MTDDKCQQCVANDAEPLHTCPYKDDVYNDNTQCNCCASCTTNCAMDI